MFEIRCMECMKMYDGNMEVCPYCGYSEKEYNSIGYHLPSHTVLEDTYIIGKTLGYGGFGITYVGYNAILERKVAIKEYLPGEFATRSPGDTAVTIFTGEKEKAYHKGLERFEQEAKKLARLKNCEGVVQIYDCFQANNTVYIVMECLEGETLRELLKREGKLKVERATEIIIDVLKVLDKVHSAGIIHRDISPENIFLTKEGKVKLIDFGAAKSATTSFSKSLSVIVKQGYAPPEQYYSKGKQGSWTDVYATAATYYKMLTGITLDDSMERKGKESLILPSKLKINLGKGRENALLNALELDEAHRTATAKEFLAGIVDGDSYIKRVKFKNKANDLGHIKLSTKLVIVVGMLMVITAFAIGYIFVSNNMVEDQAEISEGQVYVPNVLNLTYHEAENILIENGLTPKIVKREMIDNMPPNVIIEQNISSGTIVDKGTEIELTVSNGGSQTYISNYYGISFDDVINQLDESEVFAEYSEVESVLAPGCVVSYDVSDYSNLPKGSVINFQISKGRNNYIEEQVEVPDLVGMQLVDSLDILENNNLYIQIVNYIYNTSIPKGEIISQNYVPGEEVYGKTVVKVEVSGGKKIIRIPDLTGYKISEAKSVLEDLGLEYSVIYESNIATGPCEVIRLSEEPYNFVETGSNITIYAVGGVNIEAVIQKPANDTENIYKVGDEVKIEISLVSENTIGEAYTYIDIGGLYDKEYLSLENVEGADRIKEIVDEPNYGDMLAIRDSWMEQDYSNIITLTFKAKKKGITKFNIFTYITRDDNHADGIGNWGVDTSLGFDDGEKLIAKTDDSVDIVIED